MTRAGVSRLEVNIDSCQSSAGSQQTKHTARVCAALLTAFGLTLCTVAESRAHGVQQYVNGQWFDGAGFVAKTMFSVDGIFRDSVGAEKVDEPQVIDLQGGFVIPPLGDAHDHSLADSQFDSQNRDFLDKGVFYVANPNSIEKWTTAVREKAVLSETVDVRYANGGLTSTGGWPAQIYSRAAETTDEFTAEQMDGQAYFFIDDEADLDRRWPSILEGDPHFLKVYLEQSEKHEVRKGEPEYYGMRGIDPALLPAIVTKAHGAGLRVAAHVNSAADFRQALESGIDEIAHLPLETISREDAEDASRRGTVIVTTVLSHRPSPGVEDLDAVHRQNLNTLRAAGARLVFGTDSHMTVLQEAEKVAELTGMSAKEWLPILTVRTPQWIFPDRSIGELRDGFEASFLVVAENPLDQPRTLDQIRLRVKKGHLIEIEPVLPGVAEALMPTLFQTGVDDAIEEYHRLRAEKPNGYDFSEHQLNAIGYALLQHGKVADAITMFQLNVEMFPGASNPYDSLGEAYAKSGDVDRAIENYQRSLDRNPNNTGAAEKLKALRSQKEEGG